MLGYPGAGKTTTAKFIYTLTGAVHLWGDRERRQKFGNPTYAHRENLLLYNELNQVAENLLAQGKDVIFDTNFNFYKDRQNLRDIAKRHSARTVIMWLTTPKAVAKERATNNAHMQDTRVLGDMPVEAFERMSRNLDPPHKDELYVKVDGTKVTQESIKELLASIQ